MRSHPLAFPGGKFHLAFDHQRPIALRQACDELMCAGELCRFLDLDLARTWPPVGDVLGKRPMKQDRFLMHNRDLGTNDAWVTLEISWPSIRILPPFRS